ncbi:MAG: hypothetical protein HY606_03100 [Planctomycetes bacterium]|nr:hypothetical protein [Planctomycetota bacterium]
MKNLKMLVSLVLANILWVDLSSFSVIVIPAPIPSPTQISVTAEGNLLIISVSYSDGRIIDGRVSNPCPGQTGHTSSVTYSRNSNTVQIVMDCGGLVIRVSREPDRIIIVVLLDGEVDSYTVIKPDQDEGTPNSRSGDVVS